MKSLFYSILLFVAVAVLALGCERRNFDETSGLHKSHGAHEEHGDSHSDGGDHDADKKADSHKTDGKKKAAH